MMRRFPVPRPTENQAIGRASKRRTPAASVEQLRHRLIVAVRNADGAGLRLIAGHIARASG